LSSGTRATGHLAGFTGGIAVVVGVIYILGDRRLRRRESPGERLTADPRA